MSNFWLDRKQFESHSENQFPFSISMLSWAYNEEENIVEFLERSQQLMDSLNVEYEHILIDDASKDKTYLLAVEIQKKYPQLKIIQNKINMDCGWNTRIAVSSATKDILFWQTADWSYDISDLKNNLWLLKNYDVIQGVRINLQKPRYGKLFEILPVLRDIRVTKRSDNFMKAVISLTNYLLIRFLFRVPLLDFQNVTLYPTKLAQSIDFESHSSFSNPEMIMKAYWMGAKIKQVPINFIARDKGEAKGTRWKSVRNSIQQILKYWFKWMVLGQRKNKGKGQITAPDLLLNQDAQLSVNNFNSTEQRKI